MRAPEVSATEHLPALARITARQKEPPVTAESHTEMDLYEEFAWRGLIYDATPEVKDRLAKEKVTAYIGFDPTARSLHVGSLLPIMSLARLQRHGHSPIAVVGGGTGMIGDPSGKTAERQLLTAEVIEENLEGLRNQLSPFLDFESKGNPARMINNMDWLGDLSFIEFLRDVGKHFTVNYMIAKESVKRRLDAEDGLSYTEFSYMLLQAYDYLVLHDRYNCTLQMGGSDQWGNILAGAELIRRLRGVKASAVVFPLVTNATGTKFGKTESGTIWLDGNLTSPYRFYQFWLNTDDRDVIPYLRFFTWLDKTEVAALEESLERSPGAREAQKRLAQEVTAMVHGPSEVDRAVKASAVLFGAELSDLTAEDLLEIFEEVPSSTVRYADLDTDGMSAVDLFADSGLVSSKGEARRLLRGGGLRVNNRLVSDESYRVTINEAIDGKLLLLRKGKKYYHLVRIA